MKAKNFCIIALILAIAMFIAPISESWAEEKEPEVKTSGDYEYIVLEDGTACIKIYNGKDAKVIIPEEIDGIKVTGIGYRAFVDCIDLTEITIPDSVQSIGDNAFSVCTNLTKIKIPDSVQSIGDGAFSFCENLTEITIPDSVEKIDDNPFMGCVNLLNINISDGHPTLAFIDNALFYKPEKKIVTYLSTSKKSKYEIPDGIESIGERSFYHCRNLIEIKIPDSVQSIGDSAFLGCTNLTEIEIPDSVQSIGDFGFLWCENLTEINIPDSIQSIGNGAFYGCDNLKKIKIPTSVKTIGKEAFKDCDNITVTVEKGSFAEKYCKENNINYMYEDSLDWLKN